MSVDQDLSRIHGGQIFPLGKGIVHMPVGCVKAQAVQHQKAVIRHAGKVQHHLVNLCLAVSPDAEYLFPQGIIKPPNYRPIEFQTGLAYIAEKAAKKYGKVALMPVAVNYMFLRDNRPEVLVEMGDLIELNDDKPNRKEFSDYLAKTLEALCDKQFYDISQANFKGYDTLFQKKLKWYRRIEQKLKGIGIKGSGV